MPGHGQVAGLATANADTMTRLEALRAHMKTARDDGIDFSATVRGLDAQPFMWSPSGAELHPESASRICLELERE